MCLPGHRASRRAVLAGAGALGVLGAAGCHGVGAGASAGSGEPVAEASPAFMAVSRRLTGYNDLNALMGGRIEPLLAIPEGAPGLSAALEELGQAMLAMGSTLKLASLTPPLRALADTILRAWQTGVVGQGAKATVVAYEDTLMYRPIADVCVLPTYARAEPHYWAQPPRVPAPRRVAAPVSG